MGEEEVSGTTDYKNYIKVGNLMLPTEVTRNMAGQEFTIKFSDYKLNEGVSEADFK